MHKKRAAKELMSVTYVVVLGGCMHSSSCITISPLWSLWLKVELYCFVVCMYQNNNNNHNHTSNNSNTNTQQRQ